MNTTQSEPLELSSNSTIKQEVNTQTTEELSTDTDSGTLTILENNGCTYHIIGTAHVSEESTKEVSDYINKIKPDAVCVELCQRRYDAITDENRWKKLNIFEVIKTKQMLFLLANLAVGAFQRKIGAQLGVKPGEELITATKVAKENGSEIVLIDRDINTTLKRTWANLNFIKKLTLFSAILDSLLTKKDDMTDKKQIEELKKKANLSSMMDQFAKELPEIHTPLIDERDRFLCAKMRDVKKKNVVAVVGAGHVPGIINYFEKPINTDEIDQLPPPSKIVPILKWLLPLILIASLIYGYIQNGPKTLYDMIFAWILPNSIFAMLFAILAGAKFLSIIAAFILSPITSLTPLIGAGIVIALLEAWLRKPTVEDCEKINEDAHSLKGFYKNPFTRVLLVGFAVTMGSALGAWIGIAWVLTILT